MKLVYVFADNQQEWNSSEWRCVIPARAINRSGKHQAALLSIKEFADNSPDAQQLCGQADIILVERNLFGPVLTAVMRWKSQGKGVLANFDDAYHLLPENNLSHNFWMKGDAVKKENGQLVKFKLDPPPIVQFKWGLRMVDGAVVASRLLAEDWQDFTATYHLPMYLDLTRYQDLPPKQGAEITIGWSGSLSHLHSFSKGVLTALERVCRSRPQVRIKVGNDRRIYDRLKVPASQKSLTGWVPHEEWPAQLATYDIGLAPMEGEFDARRSWVKVLEYMAVKTPWIASQSPAYQELARYGQLVENRAEAWEKTLLEMVDQIEDYRSLAAGEPYQYALSQSADANVEHMVDVFRQLAGPGEKSIGEGSQAAPPSTFPLNPNTSVERPIQDQLEQQEAG